MGLCDVNVFWDVSTLRSDVDVFLLLLQIQNWVVTAVKMEEPVSWELSARAHRSSLDAAVNTTRTSGTGKKFQKWIDVNL